MTRMWCDGVNAQGYGGYNAHQGVAPYVRVVPFEEAIRNPPRCTVHDRPYLTEGGYRLSKVLARFVQTGEITAACRIDFGSEQATWCHSHGFAGRASEVRDERCPHALIAAWIARRHGLVA